MDMGFEARGKRVLVTGASSGIGAGLAERFAREGAVVGICARREDRLADVLERCRTHSPTSQMWVVDLADLDAVDTLAASAVEALGGIDVLVNNAAIPRRKHLTALDAATVESVMHINFFSPVRLTFALLPQMLERGTGQIVNVSSVAATLSSPGEAAYSASKAALSVFSESVAVDLWGTGVKVLTVYPGVVDTELFSIPDNDPLTDAVEKITVDELVDGVMEALSLGVLEVYIPAWFKDIAARKASDVGAFLAGTAEWVRQQGST
jgi:short-subunit dehydrogenase